MMNINRRNFIKAAGISGAAVLFGGCWGDVDSPVESRRPNVVVVLTDDQGYGDLGCHGNPYILTPNMDSLFEQSVRLKDYHAGPTCAPTRASLMTGRYCNRTGVWHTIAGRSILKEDEVTLTQVLSANGYKTGLFGKWHLGDTYPYRPQDRGFDEVLCFGGGGVGQTLDYWGNDYFNDTYFHNGTPEKFTGYCSEVWFDGAMDFIEQNKSRPFFAYISTNAPHSPYNIDPKYAKPYIDNPDIPNPQFYGMITNVDENLGRLMEYLDKSRLSDNTLLIFMTDNGTAAGFTGSKGFNAGMRGKKGSAYDGGHRVPCFLRYPAGGIGGGWDIEDITSHIDIMPTIIDICGVDFDKSALDGVSLLPYLKEPKNMPPRVLITDSQRIDMPVKWRNCSTMTNRWRLIDGIELYDIKADPGQTNDVATDNPDVVKQLRTEYEKWWESVSKGFDEYTEIVIGSEKEPCTLLSCHDWHPEPCPWNQRHIREAMEANGAWSVRFESAGEYEFELRRWPKEADVAINGVAEQPPVEAGVQSWPQSKCLNIAEAKLAIGDKEVKKDVRPGQKFVRFRLQIDAGPNIISTEFSDKGGELSLGAYYVYVTKIKDCDKR